MYVLSGLPYGFWPIVHTFGLDQYRVIRRNPLREQWSKYFWNDSPKDPNWPVFIEGVAVPKSQAPRDWYVMGGLLDRFPRTVYYGGPISRAWAPDYVKQFENWAKGLGYAYEISVIPVQPLGAYRHPSQTFTWYIANETRPPKRYRYIRAYDTSSFRWVDVGFDIDKYRNFHRQNPTVM